MRTANASVEDEYNGLFNRLVDSILYPSLVGGFFEILQNHTSSVMVFFKRIANYLNKIFTRKNNMKIRQTVRHQILNFSRMWLALQFSFHRLFCDIFQTVLDGN